GIGIERIELHDQALVGHLLDVLPDGYGVVSPRAQADRSTLVVLTHDDSERLPAIANELAQGGIDVALRNGQLRIAPHLYNSSIDIDAAVVLLGRASPD